MELEKFVVFAVDDDPVDLKILQRHLDRIQGVVVDMAMFTSWADARPHLEKDDAGVLIIDYSLGKMTGLEVLKELRDSGDDRPIIVLTGQGDEEIAAALSRAGVDDYLMKRRLDSDSLHRSIRHVVAKREAARALRQAKEKAERATEAKSIFLANMSHELRAPLNSILVLADMLAKDEDDRLSAKQMQFAQTIRNSGQDLLSLINDILDLSKVEAGRMVFEYESVSIDEITQTLRRMMEPTSSQKGLDFRVEIDQEAAGTIITDSRRVRQILKNLLSNAIKFTNTGSVELRIYRPRCDEDFGDTGLSPETTVAFAVIDTGIGIPAHKQALVFEDYAQANRNTNRKYGGTGLGLALSRNFARALGGSLQVTSRENEGSTFTLFLPRAPLKHPSLSGGQDIIVLPASICQKGDTRVVASALLGEVNPRLDSVLSGKKALLVEDDMRTVFAFSSVMEKAGMEVSIATTGRMALEILQDNEDLDVVLADIVLPEMDGFQTIRSIRRTRAGKNLPVIAVTALAMEGDREKCFESGADEYLAKPVNADVLMETLRKLVNKSVTTR